MNKRRWPWIAFGALLLLVLSLALIPPPDPYAAFDRSGTPIPFDDFSRAMDAAEAAELPVASIRPTPEARHRAWAMPEDPDAFVKSLKGAVLGYSANRTFTDLKGREHGLSVKALRKPDGAQVIVLAPDMPPKGAKCLVAVIEPTGIGPMIDRLLDRFRTH